MTFLPTCENKMDPVRLIFHAHKMASRVYMVVSFTLQRAYAVKILLPQDPYPMAIIWDLAQARNKIFMHDSILQNSASLVHKRTSCPLSWNRLISCARGQFSTLTQDHYYLKNTLINLCTQTVNLAWESHFFMQDQYHVCTRWCLICARLSCAHLILFSQH